MNIAIVLYGQPRDFLKGYENINNIIKNNINCKFDFFYHCWTLNENEIYNHSPWRNNDKNTLIYNSDIDIKLKNLYNPIMYEYENQSNIVINKSIYENSIAYNNTSDICKKNVNNILFQLYSRNKARNLLNKYLNEINNLNYYDFVLFVRFDLFFIPIIKFNELNKINIYIAKEHYPRKIIADNCIVMSTKIFLEWFNIYEELNNILNNNDLSIKINNLNEHYAINAEELLFAKYIYHYNNTNNILFYNYIKV
jgi:hypothetical protein